jgi:tetratricopeptide (TPR) repeat protein
MFGLFRTVACVMTALVPTYLVAQRAERFQFTEKPGPFSVGLKVVLQYDYSRTWRGELDELGIPTTVERARPLQTLIWYPAQKTAAPTMTVRDYVMLRATETDFAGKANDAPEQDEGRKEAFSDHLWAVRDAPIAAGHFPVIIYAPSFSAAPWENADLCEYLASHGYVVLASPNMGATTRAMTGDVPGIEAQARDISFLIGYASTLPDVDTSEVAVGGFSWGGISNLFAASRDNRIKALFALDGSMRYFPGLIKESGYVRPDQMRLPLLFFTQGDISLEEQEVWMSGANNTGHNPLNAWTHGDLITVHMLGLSHGEFGAMIQRDEKFWKESSAASGMKADYTRADGITSYAWVARYTLTFLNAYLKQDATAMAWLKKTPAENGVPPHYLAASFRAGTGTPTTLDGFREELHSKGFDHAAEIYAEFQKEDAAFKLDEGFINNWGYDLLHADHVPEAIEIFKLNVKLHPDSANTYDSLGEAYMKAGDKQLAIENYKKSLEKNPSDDDAKAKLKELEK